MRTRQEPVATQFAIVVVPAMRHHPRSRRERGPQHSRGWARRELKRLWRIGKTGPGVFREGTVRRSRNPISVRRWNIPQWVWDGHLLCGADVDEPADRDED